MTKEYIERVALVRVLAAVLEEIEGIVPFGEKNTEFKNGIVQAKKADINCIKNFKSADVTPVIHGRWYDEDSVDAHGSPIYRCSVCNKTVADYHISEHKYCLHCGAEMLEGSLK